MVHTQETGIIGSDNRDMIVLSQNGTPPKMSLNDMLHLVLKRKKLLLIGIVTGLVLGGLFCLIYPAKYDGITQVQYNPQSQSGFDLGEIASAFSDNDVQMQTQAQIIQSEDILWEVIRKYDLVHNKYVAHGDTIPAEEKIESITPKQREKILLRFENALLVTVFPKTQIIQVRFRCHDPKLAANIVNDIAQAYEDRNYKSQYNATLSASTWLNEQLVDLKSKVNAAQMKLAEYQKKTGIIGTIGSEEPHDVYVTRLDELNKVFANAQSERIIREARYRIAEEGNPDRIAELAPDTTLPVLRTQLADLNNTYAQLKSEFGDRYPRVVDVKNQIKQVQASIDTELNVIRDRFEKEYRAALQSETMMNAELEKQKQSMYNLTDAAANYDLLKREVDSSSDVYEDLQKKLNEAGITAGLQATTNVTLVQHAEVPGIPTIPNVPLTLGIGFLLGCLGGVGAMVVADNMDTTIRNPEHVEMINLTVLGVIPRMATQKLNGRKPPAVPLPASGSFDLPVLYLPESIFAEAFRSLRTTLMLSSAGSPPRVLAVTSALPGDGKTTTCINMAAVLAQKGKKVLLVDADLRRGMIASRMKLTNGNGNHGLAECLAGVSSPEDVIMPVAESPTLQVLGSGMRAPNPGELLDSDRMRELIQVWRSQYDAVVIDCPPLIGLSDPLSIAMNSDKTLLVARCAKTGRQSLKRVRDMLAKVHIPVLGVILNDFDLKSADYSQYYGYASSDYQGYYSSEGKNGGGK